MKIFICSTNTIDSQNSVFSNVLEYLNLNKHTVFHYIHDSKSGESKYTFDKLIAEINEANVFIAEMSIDRLGFANESFDVVVSTGVLHQAKNIEEYDRAISEVARVLRPGGLFTGNIFTNRCWDETYSVPAETEPYTVVTNKELWMTLLPKSMFYEMASHHNLELEKEVIEEIKHENTGDRAVLRFHMRKT